MDAIHISRTSRNFHMEDFNLLSMILSAMKWREKNGTITMMTDRAGAAYFQKYKLEILWDRLDTRLDQLDPGINRDIFWAGGKLLALSVQKAPCVMLDTDFIVWEKIDFTMISQPLGVIHSEPLYPDVYPDSPDFYGIDDDFDWDICPCNTAFVYINDDAFLQYYTKKSIDFMQKEYVSADPLTYMVFAEQRLFPMCAAKLKTPVYYFSDLERLFDGNRLFTHVWGFKEQMRQDYALRYDFCKRCMVRIKKDFPALIPVLEQIDILKQYL